MHEKAKKSEKTYKYQFFRPACMGVTETRQWQPLVTLHKYATHAKACSCEHSPRIGPFIPITWRYVCTARLEAVTTYQLAKYLASFGHAYA